MANMFLLVVCCGTQHIRVFFNDMRYINSRFTLLLLTLLLTPPERRQIAGMARVDGAKFARLAGEHILKKMSRGMHTPFLEIALFVCALS